MRSSLSRRQFLRQSSIGAGALLGSTLLHAEEPKGSPNERLAIGVIGLEHQGRYNWGELAKTNAEIVALCDVNEDWSGGAREKFPKATFFKDYRKLLESKGLDAVLIATPDHHHASAAYRALQAGLHVYCEKPLTHDVWEARLLAETAKKQKRVTQMGTQIHAGENYRRVVELVQSGAIGPVKEVHVWVGKGWGGTGTRPTEKPPVPSKLDWDLWLGPVVNPRDYHPAYTEGGKWRSWWDFGGGTLADMACHYCDLPFWALKLRHPTKIKATGPEVNPEMCAVWTKVEYDFPARGELPAVKLTWYDGGKRPERLQQDAPDWKGDGVLFVGEKGNLISGYGTHRLLPEKTFRDFVPPAKTIPASIGHHKEWVEACKTGSATTCNFDYSGALTEAVLLGVVSFRTGKTIEWDAATLTPKNCPEAQKLIRREYRKGWEIG